MATEINLRPSRTELLESLQNLNVSPTSTTSPENSIKLALSADPNGPTMIVPKDMSKDKIQEVINSDQFINDMFDKGYLFVPGLDAEAIPLESLDDGAFTKQFKSGANFVKRIPSNIMSIIADAVDNEEMQQKWQTVTKQYQLKADAERFFLNEEGQLEEYDLNIFNILNSESKLQHFTDFAAGSMGNAFATSIPFLFLRYAPPVIGGAIGLFGGPMASIRATQLGNKFGKYASRAYLAAMAGADITEGQLEVTDDPDLRVTMALAPLYTAAEIALGAPVRFEKIIGKSTKEGVGKYTLGKFTKDVAATMAREAGAETIQESLVETAGTLEKGKRDGDITGALQEQVNDPEFYKTVLNAGAMGAFGGAPFGAAGGTYKYIISPSDKDKDFKGSISNATFRVQGKDIDDIAGKRVNVSNIQAIYDKNGELVKNKQGDAVTPEFIVTGIVNMNGEDFYVLNSTQGGAQQIIPVSDRPNISLVIDPIEPTKEELKEQIQTPESPPPKASRIPTGLVGVSQEQAEGIARDMKQGMTFQDAVKKNAPNAALAGTAVQTPEVKTPEEKPIDEFTESDEEIKNRPLINTKTHQANERKLKSRGYDLKGIKGNNDEAVYRQDVADIASDNLNELSTKENDTLNSLGYFKGENGRRFIQRLLNDVNSKDAKSKTNGRLQLENIINNKIKFKPFTFEQMEKIGEEIISEPLTADELRKTGISLGIIDRYTTAELDQALKDATDPKEISKIKAYKLLKSTRPRDRLRALQNIINGKYQDLGPASTFNSRIQKFKDEIAKINRSTFLTPQEKAREIKALEGKIQSIEEAKVYVNELLITLGMDTLTDEDFNNLKSIPKDVKNKILGQKKIIREKRYYKFWNKFNNITPKPPKLKDSVYDDLPSMEADFRSYLLRTVGPNVDLKFVDEIKGADGFPGNGFFQFIGNYNLVDLATRDAEVAIFIAKNNMADPSIIGINQDPRLYTLHHEAMHAIFTMLSPEQQKRLLDAAEKSWIKEFKIEQRYAGAPRFVQQLEAISDRFAQYKANQYQPRGIIKKIFDIIENILRGIGNILLNRNYQSVHDIFEEADLGIIRKKFLDRKDKELQKTKDLNIEQSTLLNRSNFQAWFKNSVVKGGTHDAITITGQGTNNANANLLIKNRLEPSIKNQFPEIKKTADIIKFPTPDRQVSKKEKGEIVRTILSKEEQDRLYKEKFGRERPEGTTVRYKTKEELDELADSLKVGEEIPFTFEDAGQILTEEKKKQILKEESEKVISESSISIFGSDEYADVRRIVLQSLSRMDLNTYGQVAQNLIEGGQDTLIYINEDQRLSALYEVDNADIDRLEQLYNAIPVSFRKGQGIEKSSDNIPFIEAEEKISDENDILIRKYLLDISKALDLLTGNGRPEGIPNKNDIADYNFLIDKLSNFVNKNHNMVHKYMTEDRRVADIVTFAETFLGTYLNTPAQNFIYDLLIGPKNQLFQYNIVDGAGGFKDQFNSIRVLSLTQSDIDRANAPLVAFHGTTKQIPFIGNTVDLGAHVGTAGQANSIIRNLKDRTPSFPVDISVDKQAEYLKNAQVYPVMVSIQNPLRMPDLGNWLPNVVLETLTGDPNKFQIVQNPASVKIRDQKEAPPNTLYKPIFTKVEQRRILKAMENKNVRQQYKILINEIQNKGYDGIVYRNEFERDLELFDKYLFDSYIVFKPTQLKSVYNNGNYDSTIPNILESRSFTPDPSDPPLEQGQEPPTREQQRRDFAQFNNKINQVKGMFDKGGTQSLEKWSTRSKIFGHPRNWAIAGGGFEFLFENVRAKDRKQTEIVTEFTSILQDYFIPAMGDPEVRDALIKALEISQQPISQRSVNPETGEPIITKRSPGIFRANENGEIVFVAQENGRAAGSTVKAGETVVLRGNAARAYEDVQKALAVLHGEVVKGLLADENTRDVITNGLRILRDYRPDLANNGIVDFNMPVEEQENLTYRQLSYILEKLKESDTILQPDTGRDEVLTKVVPPIVGTTRGTKTNPQGSGLSALVADLKQFEDFKKNDYVPLQRYGNFYITVKEKQSGDLVDYRQFNKGKFGTSFLDEEPEVRAELEKKYSSGNFVISNAQEVSIAELRKMVGDDFDSLDSVAQHLSDVNVNAYLEVRKELDSIINKKVGRNIRGYSFYFKPRREIGGVPGFSNDFGRALTQYAQAAAQAAAANRYNTSSNRLLKEVTDPAKEPNGAKRRAYQQWYDYASDPEQEFANLRRLGFWWYLGGNLSSAFLQLLSLIQITGPYIAQFGGEVQTKKELARAFAITSKMLSGKNRSYQDLFLDIRRENLPEDQADDFLAAVFNGVIKQGSAVREAGMPSGTLNIRTRNSLRSKFRTVENTIIGGAFQTFETFARSTAFLAIHRLAQDPTFRKNATEFLMENNALFRAAVAANGGVVTPRIIAEELTEETFGLYNKINKPKIMRSLGAPVFLFQTYISQMMGIFLRMMTAGNKNRKYTGQKIFGRMMLAIFLSAGFFGLPGGEDGAFLFDLIRKIYTGVDKDLRQDFRVMLDDLGTPQFLIEAAENGLINAVANVDINKRIAFRFPGSDQARAALNVLGAPVPQDLSAITGAPGAIFIDNARKLFQELTQTGGIKFSTYIDALLPTFLKNIYKGFEMSKDGRAYSSTGTLLTDDLNALDILWQSIGFTPTKISKEREALRLEKFTGGETRMFRTRINNLITEGFRNIMVGAETNDRDLIEKGNDQLEEALEKVIVFNSKMDPTYNFFPDVDALRNEAMKDLFRNFRLTQYPTGQIIRNLRDREVLGLD